MIKKLPILAQKNYWFYKKNYVIILVMSPLNLFLKLQELENLN
jgi:hypothetical protein